MQISEVLLNSVKRFGDKPFLYWEEGSVSYHKLYRMAVHNAKKLKSLGVRPDDRVLLLSVNGPEYLAAYFALQFIGAIPAPLNPTLKITELEKARKLTGSRFIAAHPAYSKILDGCLPNCTLYYIETAEEENTLFSIYPRDDDDPGQIRFTSGTTGDSKGVLLSQKNITWKLECPSTHYREDDVFLCPIAFPFRIVKIMTAMGLGAPIVSTRSFSIKSIISCLKAYPISWIWGTPAIYQKMAESIDPSLMKNMRGVSSLGAYLPARIQKDFQDRFNIYIYQQYGLSEGMEAIEAPVGHPPRLGCAGMPCKDVNLYIDSPVDGEGEVMFSGPNVMLGYLDPEQNRGILKKGPDGSMLLVTGDIGRVDEDGFLFITGRKKRMISVDGLKVSPVEIEEVIYRHPGVKLVKVTGVSDPLRGEIPAAYIVMKENYNSEEWDIRKHCMKHLANYKIPRKIHFVHEIPVNSNGKMA